MGTITDGKHRLTISNTTTGVQLVFENTPEAGRGIGIYVGLAVTCIAVLYDAELQLRVNDDASPGRFVTETFTKGRSYQDFLGALVRSELWPYSARLMYPLLVRGIELLQPTPHRLSLNFSRAASPLTMLHAESFLNAARLRTDMAQLYTLWGMVPTTDSTSVIPEIIEATGSGLDECVPVSSQDGDAPS